MGIQPPTRNNLKYKFSDSGCKAGTTTALVLFSGGLDSLLAAKIMESLGFKTTALIFESAFFRSERPLAAAKENLLNPVVHDISAPHLKIVKDPRYGYGKNMNPCIDCHILMLSFAKKIAEKENSIIATGEVLGQRPMSQNKGALNLIEKRSGLANRILRPLSAKLLPPTAYETEGLIGREDLFDISGRGRKKQFELAKKFRITKYATPSGGCVLTDPIFSTRLQELLEKTRTPDKKDIALIQSGRIFWYGNNLAVIGRNENDNNAIKDTYKKKSDFTIELADFNGPLLLIRNFSGPKMKEKEIKEVAEMLAWYYPRIRQERAVRVKVKKDAKEIFYSVEPIGPVR